jgi:GntR family transcriptional repressor for pyruvate dehydrogenase complex
LQDTHPKSQFDLLEMRHALEGIAAYYAALRDIDEDTVRIRDCQIVIQQT